MTTTKHAFPRLEWTPCSEPPDGYRRVLVWHRVRPWCRFYEPVVGWWNGEGWWRDDSDSQRFGLIYQPVQWQDIEGPETHAEA